MYGANGVLFLSLNGWMNDFTTIVSAVDCHTVLLHTQQHRWMDRTLNGTEMIFYSLPIELQGTVIAMV